MDLWQKSRELNLKLFNLLSTHTDFKNGFLVNHIYKTSGSIMDNIAEGFERGGNKEFIQFLYYSKGNAGELRSQIYRAFDLNLLTKPEMEQIKKELITISTQLMYFINFLKNSEIKGYKFK